MSNILSYIPNFIENPPHLTPSLSLSSNRANSMGDNLESYIKDTIANIQGEKNAQKRLIATEKAFSWTGNTNNIPDAILKNGDALEIKKVESKTSNLQLNSSHPKDFLYSSDTRIKKDVISCEQQPWDKKNLFYAIGHVPKGTNKINHLFFIDGCCYAANKETYQSLSQKISTAAKEAENVTFHETNELANIRNVDPLGITLLRVRGMWIIQTPYTLFSDLIKDTPNKFNLCFLTEEKKYKILPQTIKKKIEAKADVSFIKIPNPNNPAQTLNAVLINYEA